MATRWPLEISFELVLVPSDICFRASFSWFDRVGFAPSIISMVSVVRFEYFILVSPFLVGDCGQQDMVTNSSQINALFYLEQN